MRAIDEKNTNFDLKELFKGLFTQGMVCHQTYKDKHNNWLSPDEVDSKDNKIFIKNNSEEKVFSPQSLCLNQKKILLIQQK